MGQQRNTKINQDDAQKSAEQELAMLEKKKKEVDSKDKAKKVAKKEKRSTAKKSKTISTQTIKKLKRSKRYMENKKNVAAVAYEPNEAIQIISKYKSKYDESLELIVVLSKSKKEQTVNFEVELPSEPKKAKIKTAPKSNQIQTKFAKSKMKEEDKLKNLETILSEIKSHLGPKVTLRRILICTTHGPSLQIKTGREEK